MSTNIGVFVRVRPSLPREKSLKCLIQMPVGEPHKTILEISKGTREYVFDECIWSHDTSQSNYLDNEGFYQKCGYSLLVHLYQGYNVCLLAYGQTGAGKTYTMMGHPGEEGIIPLVVRDILLQRDALIKDKINCEISVSFLEIHNEKVKDLFGDSRICRVRESPQSGPYVEGLVEVRVTTLDQFFKILEPANKLRTVASTKMNDASSRSHAILTFKLKQTRFCEENDLDSGLGVGSPIEEIVSNIKLVDLAGSERLTRSQNFHQVERLKEGNQINKSLTVLGRCINILSLSSQKHAVVPYRDSVLTYLLKENLSGNSKTTMVFCISPTDLEETQQTLNYATQVKCIKTKAKANASKLVTSAVARSVEMDRDMKSLESLKREIDILNNELDNYKKQEQTNGVSALFNYLERENNRQAFEIKFLKNKVLSKDEELDELRIQSDFHRLEMHSVVQLKLELQRSYFAERAGEISRICGAEAQSCINTDVFT